MLTQAEWTPETLGDLVEYLQRPEAPRDLVLYEFSGALRDARREAGHPAISVDLRSSEAPGLHYRGDVRDVVGLCMWDIIFAVGPNCYQHLRADLECLSFKIADGRAFWGGVGVVWSLCLACRGLVVEQPDTIVHDYLTFPSEAGVTVTECSTTNYGDEAHKFLRMTSVNLRVPEAPYPSRSNKSRKVH